MTTETTDNKVKSIDPRSLPRRFDVKEREAHWRTKWDALGISKHDKAASREQSFVIDSPPPTASGSLHPGHVFSYTHQDVIARYRRMTGWNVVYPMGWDDNGLPTERRVQNYFGVRAEPNVPYIPDLNVRKRRKELGLDKDEQLVVSRENFIELCHVVTAEDEKTYKELFNRLGFSIDWDEEYATIDDRCRSIAQRSFLDLDQRGHVYTAELPNDVGRRFPNRRRTSRGRRPSDSWCISTISSSASTNPSWEARRAYPNPSSSQRRGPN